MRRLTTLLLEILCVIMAALTCVLLVLGIAAEARKLAPKPAAVHACDAQAGKVIYAHRRKQARCMVQV